MLYEPNLVRRFHRSAGVTRYPAIDSAGTMIRMNRATDTTRNTRRIVVIETSGRIGSTALADDQGVIASTQLTGRKRHAGELMPAIDQLLKEQDWSPDTLTDIFVSIGPGSFTGLRVGVTVTRTLAWSLNLRIVAVPSLDALARNGLQADPRPQRLAVILDAKRDQVFTAAFDLSDDACRKCLDAQLADPSAFLSQCAKPIAALGEGVPYHQEAIKAGGATVLDEAFWWPRVENVYQVGIELARQGQYTPGSELLPLYIRRPEAEEKWEKLHGPQGRRIR